MSGAGGGRAAALLLALLVAAWIGLSLVALPAFGLAWDEALGDLFFGHRTLAHLGSGDDRLLVFDRRAAVDGDGREHPDLFRSPLRNRPWEHWPVMATLSAATCTLFARSLGLLNPVDAHHLAGPLVVALLLPLAYLLSARAWGRGPAWVGLLALLCNPRFVAAAWTDLKDTGTAVFVTAALLLAWRGLVTARPLPYLAAGVAAGLALGTKANVLFLPLPLAAFILAVRPALPRPRRQALAAAAAAPLVALALVWLAWPWLRADPVARLGQNLAYVFGRAATGPLRPNPWPALTLLASWPLATLPLVVLGVGRGLGDLARRRPSLDAVLVLAAGFPLARLAAPGVTSFDGFRHGLELVPPLALLAGSGARALLARAGAPPPRTGAARRAAAAFALVLAPVAALVEVMLSHPYQVAHMGPLVGGPAGARRLGFPQVEDYWATSYRRAYRWLDQHAEPGAAVAAGVAEHLLFIEGTFRLRADLEPVRASSPFRADPGPEVAAALARLASQRPVYLFYITRTDWYGPIVSAAEARPPAWVEGPPGAPLLKVVRLGPPVVPPPAAGRGDESP